MQCNKIKICLQFITILISSVFIRIFITSLFIRYLFSQIEFFFFSLTEYKRVSDASIAAEKLPAAGRPISMTDACCQSSASMKLLTCVRAMPNAGPSLWPIRAHGQVMLHSVALFLYVTLDHKTSHKGQFFETEIYPLAINQLSIDVWFGRDTITWKSGIWGCKNIKMLRKLPLKLSKWSP